MLPPKGDTPFEQVGWNFDTVMIHLQFRKLTSFLKTNNSNSLAKEVVKESIDDLFKACNDGTISPEAYPKC